MMRPDASFLGQPIRSLQTMLRILAEDDGRHLSLVPDGIYGPETTAAVARFQQLHGLPITGVTDQKTWEAIEFHHRDARTRTEEAWPIFLLLDPGEEILPDQRHPHLRLVQAMLWQLGETWGSIPQPESTGVLDPMTEDALAVFQELHGYPVTGKLDKVTWKALALHYPLAAARPVRKNILPNY